MNTRMKKRKAAEAFNEKANTLAARKKLKAYKLTKKAVKEQADIAMPEQASQQYHDWRALSKYQANCAEKSNAQPKELKWYTRALKTLRQIPKEARTHQDWSWLMHCVNAKGVACEPAAAGLKWHQKALKKTKKIPKIRRDAYFYNQKADFQFNIYESLLDEEKKLRWLKKSIKNYQKIPLGLRDAQYSRELARCQFLAGAICKKLADWQNAWNFLQAALDNEEIDYFDIRESYRLLAQMSYHCVNRALYETGQVIFNTEPIIIQNLKEGFQKAYLQALQTADQHYLFQLLRLVRQVEKYGTRGDFPKQAIKDWLSDPEEAKQLKHLLHELQTAYQPPALAGLLEHSYSSTVALTLKIHMLENRIAELEKARREHSALSPFNSFLTVFGKEKQKAKAAQQPANHCVCM